MSVSEHVIYLIVRKDLKMGAGKVAAQCGHAVQELILTAPKTVLNAYLATGVYPKITLRVNSKEELLRLEDEMVRLRVLHHVVCDVGRTQVAPDTLTVMGVGPLRRSETPQSIQALKLY